MVADARWTLLNKAYIFRRNFLRQDVIDLNARRPTGKGEFGGEGIPIESSDKGAMTQIEITHDDDSVFVDDGKSLGPSFNFEQLQVVEERDKRQMCVDDDPSIFQHGGNGRTRVIVNVDSFDLSISWKPHENADRCNLEVEPMP